jgi:pimeloyl-ACP methyl ester carboxylesterase
VLICHGISSNKSNWDITDRLSFPYYLSHQGFDVWLVELRASGESQKPGWFDDLSWGYTFDDYVLHDAPALVDYILKATGAEQLHWVGHSMGGMLLYGYLERVGQEKIRSGTAVASPPYVLDHNKYMNRASWQIPVLDFTFDWLPLGFWSRFLSPLAPWPIVDETRLIWNHDNMSKEAARRAAANAVSDVSVNIIVQFANSLQSGALQSLDGSWDYAARLSKITVPMFVAAGSVDQLAPPAVVAFAYRSLSSTDKKIEVFSRANGYAADYGHVDLVLGETAPVDVFPVLAAWLETHD